MNNRSCWTCDNAKIVGKSECYPDCTLAYAFDDETYEMLDKIGWVPEECPSICNQYQKGK